MISLIALLGIAIYLTVLGVRGFSYDQEYGMFSYNTVRGLFITLAVVAAAGAAYRLWILWG